MEKNIYVDIHIHNMLIDYMGIVIKTQNSYSIANKSRLDIQM